MTTHGVSGRDIECVMLWQGVNPEIKRHLYYSLIGDLARGVGLVFLAFFCIFPKSESGHL